MGLVGIAEGVEACGADLHHTGPDLLQGKRMAVADPVLIFGDAIDEQGAAVDGEGMRARRRRVGPMNPADAAADDRLVDEFVFAEDLGNECITIGTGRRPKVGIGDIGKLLMDGSGIGEGDRLLFCGDDGARSIVKRLDQIDLRRKTGVIL